MQSSNRASDVAVRSAFLAPLIAFPFYAISMALIGSRSITWQSLGGSAIFSLTAAPVIIPVAIFLGATGSLLYTSLTRKVRSFCLRLLISPFLGSIPTALLVIPIEPWTHDTPFAVLLRSMLATAVLSSLFCAALFDRRQRVSVQ
jgi:hypothetical protein